MCLGTFAVADINEDEAAEVAPGIDPAGQGDYLPDVCRAQFVAKMHCLYQGASFGGWSQMNWHYGGLYCAAVVAKRTDRPVKWLFSRREDFYGGQMDAGAYYCKVGAKKDGTVTAVEARVVLSNLLMPFFGVVHHLIENTNIPHVYGKLESVYVNKGTERPHSL